MEILWYGQGFAKGEAEQEEERDRRVGIRES
jgi:hypothetical protein